MRENDPGILARTVVYLSLALSCVWPLLSFFFAKYYYLYNQ